MIKHKGFHRLGVILAIIPVLIAVFVLLAVPESHEKWLGVVLVTLVISGLLYGMCGAAGWIVAGFRQGRG